ncbi:PRC-barrel domain-containing protein [Dehalobacter sp. DCM]|uniref:PRC-barrel domain-containing protein n=1 Tax=Dehalobacter sp. DCM TaxID=2907827 RepID=UPI003081D20A|nr:PRC-barrel domain-containing protein [Dehalobacter sp. DCM]
MKPSSEIIGLKIISLNEGRSISTVKDIIINGDNGTLAFFIVDQPSDYFGARLIAFSDVLGLGDYALIINDCSVIQDVAHNVLAVDLLKKDIRIIDSQLLTTQGCLVGHVSEMVIDETTGKIAALEVRSPQGKSSQYNSEPIITYGREIILIDESPQAGKHGKRVQTDEDKVPVKGEAEREKISEKELLKRRIEEFGKADSLQKSDESGADIFIYPDGFNVFEQRQLQFLLGKTLNSDVQLDSGIILKAGEQITAQSLSAIRTRSTLMQLTAQVMK